MQLRRAASSSNTMILPAPLRAQQRRCLRGRQALAGCRWEPAAGRTRKCPLRRLCRVLAWSLPSGLLTRLARMPLTVLVEETSARQDQLRGCGQLLGGCRWQRQVPAQSDGAWGGVGPPARCGWCSPQHWWTVGRRAMKACRGWRCRGARLRTRPGRDLPGHHRRRRHRHQYRRQLRRRPRGHRHHSWERGLSR